jgi:hypothetical protein
MTHNNNIIACTVLTVEFVHVYLTRNWFCWKILHHHQPINVSTGAQAFFMDYPQGERAITHHAGPVRVLTTANAAGTNGLTCLPKYGGARDNTFLVNTYIREIINRSSKKNV